MKRPIIVLAAGLLFLCASAHAAANWQTTGFRIDPQNVPKILAATDKFMSSPIGQQLPGSLSLMVIQIDGADPSTHSFITSVESMAAREVWTQKLPGNSDWTEFLNVVSSLSDLGATSRMIFMKSWGESGESDVVWQLHASRIDNPPGYLAALDALMGSETGKKFPGSLHLSSVAAAGLSPVSHVISVGFESAAEAEAWNEMMFQSADWAAFQKATDSTSEFLGTFVLRTLKTWGTGPTTP